MSEPYKRANAGLLTFKGGELAVLKTIDKSKHKKKKRKEDLKKQQQQLEGGAEEAAASEEGIEGGGGEVVYTIDAAKKMKYEELFPVEARRFGYDPANKDRAGARSVEEALDDRVKKKADRYCK